MITVTAPAWAFWLITGAVLLDAVLVSYSIRLKKIALRRALDLQATAEKLEKSVRGRDGKS